MAGYSNRTRRAYDNIVSKRADTRGRITELELQLRNNPNDKGLQQQLAQQKGVLAELDNQYAAVDSAMAKQQQGQRTSHPAYNQGIAGTQQQGQGQDTEAGDRYGIGNYIKDNFKNNIMNMAGNVGSSAGALAVGGMANALPKGVDMLSNINAADYNEQAEEFQRMGAEAQGRAQQAAQQKDAFREGRVQETAVKDAGVASAASNSAKVQFSEDPNSARLEDFDSEVDVNATRGNYAPNAEFEKQNSLLASNARNEATATRNLAKGGLANAAMIRAENLEEARLSAGGGAGPDSTAGGSLRGNAPQSPQVQKQQPPANEGAGGQDTSGDKGDKVGGKPWDVQNIINMQNGYSTRRNTEGSKAVATNWTPEDEARLTRLVEEHPELKKKPGETEETYNTRITKMYGITGNINSAGGANRASGAVDGSGNIVNALVKNNNFGGN